MKNICVFEDEGYKKLLPLALTRPVYDLKCGMNTLLEKIRFFYPKIVADLFCRDYLKDTLKQKYQTHMVNALSNCACTLFINGRVLFNKSLAKKIEVEGPDEIFVSKGRIVAVRLNKNILDTVRSDIKDIITKSVWDKISQKLITTEIDADFISFHFDLIHRNGEELKNGFDLVCGSEGKIMGEVEGSQLMNKKRIFVGEGASVKPGCVLDASEGPIYISKNAVIMPNSVIMGPVFIGEKSAVKIGAKIYGSTTIGEMCKVGGEVEGSIIYSHSNKQHDGFMGHSYIGQWVNWGADTNNSDLKNNYGPVKVYVDGEMIDSGHMFVGLCMADHSKSGINTMFNTGTVVGVACNVFGSGFHPKYLPSFGWGGGSNFVEYNIGKAKEVASRVMARRKINFSDADAKLIEKIFELTMEERAKFGISSRGGSLPDRQAGASGEKKGVTE